MDIYVAKFPGPDALRPFEGRIDRAVGSALDVDPLAHVDAWVAALGFSLLRVILHEGEVVLAVARDHPVKQGGTETSSTAIRTREVLF